MPPSNSSALCQNTDETAEKLEFAEVTDENRGGFVYFPGDSKAGEEESADGERVALRSYGSMSYAGLLSFIYADLDRDDPRVLAVLDWLGRNYTIEENPGLESQGLYYYYHTMAKALSAAGVGELPLADGSRVELARATRDQALRPSGRGRLVDQRGLEPLVGKRSRAGHRLRRARRSSTFTAAL